MPRPLRIVELSGTVSAAACGRLFAGLGHEVVLCEPPSGHPLRAREFTFTALSAGKLSRVLQPGDDPQAWQDLLARADVLITDWTPSAAEAASISPDHLRTRFPHLVVVSLTPFGLTGDLTEMPGDSLLAEAYGGLANMIGNPGERPLSLGGEQAAHAAAFVGLYGAMLAVRRRETTRLGDCVEVALSDVAAYMDWKSDITLGLGGPVPVRSGASRGTWRVVPAKDGWIGVIFLPHQWSALVELIGDKRLADPGLCDPLQRTERAEEWWPVVAEAIAHRETAEVYASAQQLGLPFGYACTAHDLLVNEQLNARGFVLPTERRRRDAPVVTLPVPLGEPEGPPARRPRLGEHHGVLAAANRAPARVDDRGDVRVSDGPLTGLVVVDFGTITAGAATSRLLADYGATVIKIESRSHPDGFRHWVMPGSTPPADPAHWASPMFDSNNVGKIGLCLDLKTEGGRRFAHRLIRRADVLVENFRPGVTSRMGIDYQTVRQLNPDLIYLSLSSQGSSGPESRYSSYGSTLDLLSGLAAVTGYRDGPPLWSSGDVNYPDQVVSLLGAALVAHSVVTGQRGVHLDVSQREVVAWTLADQWAHYAWTGQAATPRGNRRPGTTPHDTYPTADKDGWVAIACSAAEHRDALAALIPELPAQAPEQWWWDHQDHVDALVTDWATQHPRAEVVALLQQAGVPAVAVNTAADRAADERYLRRRVRLVAPGGRRLKGFPLLLHGYRPPTPAAAPALGEDASDWDDPAISAFLKQTLHPDAATPLPFDHRPFDA
ncbi:CoA transferase [Streptomyces sp. CA-106110]|uniref:CaiB/BaiF CoA-transferase family protein n=1 Tax=Streptomyces sp. CA-106110 TaxID=3240044 RepID=UPI003D90407D